MKYPQLNKIQLREFEQNGFIRVSLPLNSDIMTDLITENWNSLDANFQLLSKRDAPVFKLLSQLRSFSEIENIISIRDAKNEWEEDGIWHDDGSRVLAFSLGLNLKTSLIKGGELLLRKKKSTKITSIKPIQYGDIIIFKTGVDLFEHKVCAVTKGQRIIIAGWCS